MWDFDALKEEIGERHLAAQESLLCPKLSKLWNTFYDELHSYHDIILDDEDAALCEKELPFFSQREMIYLWSDEKTKQHWMKMRIFYYTFDQKLIEQFIQKQIKRWSLIRDNRPVGSS